MDPDVRYRVRFSGAVASGLVAPPSTMVRKSSLAETESTARSTHAVLGAKDGSYKSSNEAFNNHWGAQNNSSLLCKGGCIRRKGGCIRQEVHAHRLTKNTRWSSDWE